MAGCEESFRKLVDLVAQLRGPEGCPWDRAQDYDSAKGLVLEEVYEVIDAVNARDFAGLEEELGDLLLQVVFYARMAEEEGRFNIGEVIEKLQTKLVRRHPHVFGGKRAATAGEALESWNAAKRREHRRGSADHPPSGPSPPGRKAANPAAASLLEGIPSALPATLEAHELGARASAAGFDWSAARDVLDKIGEEVAELRAELASGAANPRAVEDEVGDLLFAVANLARHAGSDPESCLRRANRKFQRRFQAMEREIERRGKRIEDCGPEELEAVWNAVKEREPAAEAGPQPTEP